MYLGDEDDWDEVMMLPGKDIPERKEPNRIKEKIVKKYRCRKSSHSRAPRS